MPVVCQWVGLTRLIHPEAARIHIVHVDPTGVLGRDDSLGQLFDRAPGSVEEISTKWEETADKRNKMLEPSRPPITGSDTHPLSDDNLPRLHTNKERTGTHSRPY